MLRAVVARPSYCCGPPQAASHHQRRPASSALLAIGLLPVPFFLSSKRDRRLQLGGHWQGGRSVVRAAGTPPAEGAGSTLASLRKKLEQLQVDAIVVPTDDPHLSEIPPKCFARRAFLSSFDGSAGTAVVTAKEALLWTDGRYFLQAERQLPEGWTLMRSGLKDTPTLKKWLESSLDEKQKLGLDPSVHPASFVLDLKKEIKAQVTCLEENPVDSVWGPQRPPLPAAPVRLHEERWAGLSVAEKLAKVRKAMGKEKADVLVVSALDEVAYLLNIRGGDVERTPVVLGYLLVEECSACLFVNVAKLPEDVRQALAAAGVAVKPYEDAVAAVRAIPDASRVWLDPKTSNFALHQAIAGEPKVTKASPVAAMKAKKTEAELEGMRAAHRRDAAALSTTLARLERRVPAESITEVDVDELVTGLRAAQWGYLDNSFDTIAGYGANGAVIHYRAEQATAATLGTSSLFLLDSGAQYKDGTTDVTRTMHFGEPTQHERECFTRVLKGHIALASAVFPEGTPGFVLDAFARMPLWQSGLDYRHGTGHGVGAALGVHEGPQGIGRRYENTTALEAGMIVSNEPGYYCDGSFGIRIENLLEIVKKETANSFGGDYLGFEPLTLVPIQRKLIDVALLEPQELEYLNGYHRRVRAEIGPLLEEPEARAWLLFNTQDLAPAAPQPAAAEL